MYFPVEVDTQLAVEGNKSAVVDIALGMVAELDTELDTELVEMAPVLVAAELDKLQSVQSAEE